MKTHWRVSLAILFLTSGINVMAAPNEKPVSASNAVVTLDVFSGRPNPTWSLSEPATAELLRRIQALDAAKSDAPEFQNLGYRAVRVEFQEPNKGEVVVTASRGTVTLERTGQRLSLADAGRKFELWLANTGAGHLTPDLLRYVTGEIASKPQ
jgi:hypothetical protein